VALVLPVGSGKAARWRADGTKRREAGAVGRWGRSREPRTITGDRMTRIGFAYNQKPHPAGGESGALEAAPTAEEEPPSGGDADDRYAEWDTAETIDAVAHALGAFGHVVRLEATPEFPERLRAERPDIVFNIAEGLVGVNRESHVPAICEFFGVPYSGSDPLTLSTCLHKGRTKEVLAFNGVPTARFAVVESVRDVELLLDGRQEEMLPSAVAARPLPDAFPLFVKPVHEGSSKGVTVRNLVYSRDELVMRVTELLDAYSQPVLVEDYLPGAEFTCAVLGNGRDARVLPIVAINFDDLPAGVAPIYGFEAKWIWDTPDRPLHVFDCPARIADSLRRSIEYVTLRAYRVLGCRDWSRIDVRLDAHGVPNVVEVNPLPGILPNPADNSCFPKAARAAGMSYDALIQTCLAHAAAREHVPLARRRHVPVRGRAVRVG
jgi:D-alanine-D-alanine ligase